VKDELLPVFEKLAVDEQDSVRLLSIESCVAIATVLSIEENNSLLLPIIRNCTVDKSWRVRYMVASHFVEVIPPPKTPQP
jgi:serine/threonine-protein phosphatase 2A regulatory subunit A